MTLFATDLDGTLLTDEPAVSEFTQATLGRIAERSQVVVATGRPPRLVSSLADQLPGVEHAVCGNGAFALNLVTHALTQLDSISSEDALVIVERIRRLDPSAMFAVETLEGHRRERSYQSPYDVPDRRKGTIEEITHDGVGKILLKVSEPASQNRGRMFQATIGDLAVVTVSTPAFYELAPAGISKASGLAALALAAPSDTVAYGDMPNDIEMLQWAGAGIAVANAHDLVRTVADHVLDRSNDEDAVAHDMWERAGLPSER